jgi:hypothetical protein
VRCVNSSLLRQTWCQFCQQAAAGRGEGLASRLSRWATLADDVHGNTARFGIKPSSMTSRIGT